MPLNRRRFLSLVGLALLSGSVGCNSTETTPTGNVSAQVLNQNNAGVSGSLVELYRNETGGAILWRSAITGSTGVAIFGAGEGGVIVGDYFIRLTVTPSNELAPGETNDRPVTVTNGGFATVTFRLVPRTP